MTPEEFRDLPLLPQEELIPLTVPDVRHLLWNLVGTAPASVAHVLAWSRWRRRHQARAQRCHYRRRLTYHSLELRL